jgi:hypothetical protein
LQLLSYRKEDIMDLLMSLKSMPSTSNTKKKTESLETELLKIDSELFELEKKYGEFRVRKTSNFVELAQATQTTKQLESTNSFTNQVIEESMPEVENSLLDKENDTEVEEEKEDTALPTQQKEKRTKQ